MQRPVPPRSRSAVVSLVSALAGLLFLACAAGTPLGAFLLLSFATTGFPVGVVLSGALSVLTILYGHLGLHETRLGAQGFGLAVAGLTLGYVELALALLLALSLFIPRGP